MEVVRTVSVPLSPQPEILFGLRALDLVWVGITTLSSLGLWSLQAGLAWRMGLVSVVGGGGALAGLLRFDARTAPEWAWLVIKYYVSPRLYLS